MDCYISVHNNSPHKGSRIACVRARVTRGKIDVGAPPETAAGRLAGSSRLPPSDKLTHQTAFRSQPCSAVSEQQPTMHNHQTLQQSKH